MVEAVSAAWHAGLNPVLAIMMHKFTYFCMLLVFMAGSCTKGGKKEKPPNVLLILVDDPPDSADIELYDYYEDPLESRNLASDHPDVVKKLLHTLNQYPLFK